MSDGSVPKPLTALFMIIFIAFLHPVNAEAPTVDPQSFRNFLASDLHKTLMAKAEATTPPEVFHRCPTFVPAGSKIMIAQSITFDQKGIPNAGAWWERIPVAGCGNDTIINVYFAVGADGKIATMVAFPGTTRANLLLQRDALTFAYIGASSRAKDCKHFIVTNTRFEGFGLRNPAPPDPGADARFRPWWETWMMVGCGKSLDVPINFMPDATGTTINQPLRDVVEH
jgi:hypothetical protein